MSGVRRVGVLGARGRVGSVVCEAVAATPGLELVATVDAEDDIELLVAEELRQVRPEIVAAA